VPRFSIPDNYDARLSGEENRRGFLGLVGDTTSLGNAVVTAVEQLWTPRGPAAPRPGH
jgi:hypothetical protein